MGRSVPPESKFRSRNAAAEMDFERRPILWIADHGRQVNLQ